jgi:hypothetical protein
MNNEKIFELAKQANFEFDSNHNKFYVSGVTNDINNEILSLANLIIQECINAVNEGADQYEIPTAGKFQSAIFVKVIKNYFDIED